MSSGKVLRRCFDCGRNFYGGPYGAEGCGDYIRCVDCANKFIENAILKADKKDEAEIDYKDFYKRFAQGEQNIKIVNNRIEEEQVTYYWQENDTYNFILPILQKYKQKIDLMGEDAVYGKGGFIAQLEPLQRAYNKVMRKQMEIINKINLTPLAVEDGSVDIDAIEEEGLNPGRVLVYRQGAKQPQYMNVGLEEYHCLEDMRKHIMSMLNWLIDLYLDEDFNIEQYIL